MWHLYLFNPDRFRLNVQSRRKSFLGSILQHQGFVKPVQALGCQLSWNASLSNIHLCWNFEGRTRDTNQVNKGFLSYTNYITTEIFSVIYKIHAIRKHSKVCYFYKRNHWREINQNLDGKASPVVRVCLHFVSVVTTGGPSVIWEFIREK